MKCLLTLLFHSVSITVMPFFPRLKIAGPFTNNSKCCLKTSVMDLQKSTYFPLPMHSGVELKILVLTHSCKVKPPFTFCASIYPYKIHPYTHNPIQQYTSETHWSLRTIQHLITEPHSPPHTHTPTPTHTSGYLACGAVAPTL